MKCESEVEGEWEAKWKGVATLPRTATLLGFAGGQQTLSLRKSSQSKALS